MYIVIVGGGIAGLATAAFLRERTDHKVEVIERSEPISFDDDDEDQKVNRKGDYGIAIAPNGVACLDKLGMKDPVFELNGSELGQILLRDSTNPKEVEAQKYEFRQLFGFPSIFCRRSALIGWLTKKCVEGKRRKQVFIRNQCKIVQIDAMQGKLELIDVQKSPNTIETIQADLLICADGIEKVGRKAVLRALGKQSSLQNEKILQFSFMSVIPPEALREREKLQFLLEDERGGKCTLANFYHQAPYRGMTAEQILDALQKHKRILLYPIDHQGYHQLFAYGAMTDEILARFGRGPLSIKTKEGEDSNDSTPLPSPIQSSHHPVPRGSILHGTSTKQAYEMFEMFSPELNSLLLLNGEQEGIDLCLVRDSDPIDQWSVNGKTVLIGDAAHASVPHTGQGSSQAMEDAEALSYILAQQEGEKIINLHQVLKTFEQIRIPIAHKAQITARMANGHLPGLEKMDLEKYNQQILAWKSTEVRLKEIKNENKNLPTNSYPSNQQQQQAEENKRSTAVSVQ